MTPTLLSTFFIATVNEEGKIIIHRITESPAKAIQYRNQQLQQGSEDVRVLRKDTAGEYVDVGKGHWY